MIIGVLGLLLSANWQAHLAVPAMHGASLHTTKAAHDELSRDNAAQLIAPIVETGAAVAAVPEGDRPIVYDEYLEQLGKLGAVKVTPIDIETRRVSLAPNLAVDVLRHEPGQSIVLLARRKFREVTGIHQASATEADVEFTWQWAPNAAGQLMNGLSFRSITGELRRVELQRHYYSLKAACTLWDSGWKCQVPLDKEEDLTSATVSEPES